MRVIRIGIESIGCNVIAHRNWNEKVEFRLQPPICGQHIERSL